MGDLFQREEQTACRAEEYLRRAESCGSCDAAEYGQLLAQYRGLLRQMRRVIRVSDMTARKLNTTRLDLMDKVHYDGLTQIHNRRYMNEELDRIVGMMSRGILPHISVIMLDIDFFKRYNDTYGHTIGDRCLYDIAQMLSGTVLRKGDFVARYGGEEFVVVLPATSNEGAVCLARRILKGMKELNIPHAHNNDLGYVTVSAGIATVQHHEGLCAVDVISRADKALYWAKLEGRNRYAIYTD